MTYRTTFSLDEAAMQRIRNLSALWKESQAEVVRRAVAVAHVPTAPASPSAALQAFLQSGTGLKAEASEQYLTEVWAARKNWRGQ